MRYLLITFLCFTFLPVVLLAQSTTVSGTITDAGAQAWISGTYSFVFKVSPSNPTGPYFLNGAPFSTSQTIAGALDASGHYSVSIPSNTSIVPSGSVWTATFCPLATANCFTQDFGITGASQTVQPIPPAISISLLSPPTGPQRAYADVEITSAAIGSIYYNIISTGYRSCIAVSGQTCTTWQSIAGGGGSGNCSVAGNPGDLQKNAIGACGASSINDLNGVVNISNPTNVNANAAFKGPNPKVYASAFFVRGVNPNVAPAAPGYTGNCTTGNTTLPVSSSTGMLNNDGIVIWGCGATNTMSTPSAPTVTPSVAAAMTGTLIDTPAPAGSTSFSYKIVARDLNGGLTAASAATSITTGNPLGVQVINITSATMSNQLVTVTTSAAHGLAVGAMAVVAGTAATVAGVQPPNPFNGTFIVSTVPDNTHFTYYTNYDTRSGALAAVTGGTVTYWNCNHLNWTAVTGATQYYIYGRTSGSWNLIGVSIPFSSTLSADITGGLHWADFGSPMTTAPNLPSYVPSSAPASATNDMLITTIVSGAGTTSLVLAAAPSQTISGQTILFDNSLNYLTAANAAVNFSSNLYVPTGSSYIFNAPVTLPAKLEMELHGNLYLNETMTLSRSDELWGLPTANVSVPSFAFKPSIGITIANANPGFLGIGSNYFHWLTISPTGSNANLLYFGDILPSNGDIPGSSFDYVNFQLNNGGTDYMSMAMMFRSDHTTTTGGEFPVFLHYVLFLASQNGANTSYTPAYYASYSGGNFEADHIFLSGKGIFVRVPDTGGYTDINWIYSQGNYEPFFNFYRAPGGNSGYTFRNLSNTTFDTTTAPFVANLGSVIIANQTQTLTLFTSGVSILPSQLTGSPALANGNVNDGVYGQSGTYQSSLSQGTIGVGQGFSFITSYGPAPAPSCAVSAGGSVPVSATLAYTVVPVWANGSEGTPSLYCSAPTTTGNQTVTVSWSPPPGNAIPLSYNVYRQGAFGGGVALTNLGFHIQSPYVDTFGFTNSSTVPTVAAGGPGGLQNELHWGSNYAIETRASAPAAFSGVNLFDLAGDNYPAFNINGSPTKYFPGLFLSTDTIADQNCVKWVKPGTIPRLGDSGFPGCVAFQVNTVNNISQTGLNLINSIANSVGLAITVSNPATNQVRFEITGSSYTGNAATATNIATTGANGTCWGVASGVQGWQTSCGSSGTFPSGTGIVHHTGSLSAWDTPIPDTVALTGQQLIATNGAAAGFSSPGIIDGNGQAAVTTTPYVVLCDSATAQRDRVTTLSLQSGASVVTAPDHTASGCGSGFVFTLIDDQAGAVTVNRGGTDTFTVDDGVSSTSGLTSFTLANGNYATLNNGQSGVWRVRKVTGNAALINNGSMPTSASVIGTNASAQPIADTAHLVGLPEQCSDTSGSGTAQVCSTAPTFTPVKGDWIIYYTTTSNSGALTVNANSSGAASVLKWDATALASGDVQANKPVLMLFDGVNWLVSTIGNAPAGGGGGTPCTTTALSFQFNASGSFGCVSNLVWASGTGISTSTQLANSNDTWLFKRFTDTSPTGTFFKFQNAAAGALGQLDVSANLALNGSVSVGSATNLTYCNGGTAGCWGAAEGTAPTDATAAKADLWPDSTTHEWMAGTNGANPSANARMVVASEPAPINQTGKTAAITTATLCASAAGACNQVGQYHVHFNFWGSGTACSSVTAGSVTFLLTWTDENAVAHSAVALQMMAQTGAATTAMQASFPFQTALANESASGDMTISTNGSVIQYATGYTACTTGVGTYNLRAAVTRVQ